MVISCAEKQEPQLPPEPDNLIPENQIVLIMADLHLLEATLGMRNNNTLPPTRNILRNTIPNQPQEIVEQFSTGNKTLPYFDIFKKYGVTRQQYDASVTWYAAQPLKFSLMYDKVIDELNRRQSANQTQKNE